VESWDRQKRVAVVVVFVVLSTWFVLFFVVFLFLFCGILLNVVGRKILADTLLLE
jgi:hypothetical protein